MNNYKQMEQFLEQIKTFAKSNPEKVIDYKFVYSLLIRFNLLSRAVSEKVDDLWPEIKDSVTKNTDGLTRSGHFGSFLLFNRGMLNSNEVKLYLPTKRDNLVSTVTELEHFMAENNMAHQLKVANKMRNDNIVIRVNTLEEAQKLVEFAKLNVNLNRNLLKVNPFLANDAGVGLAMDNNESFNTVLSELIADFINMKKNYNYANVTIEEFNRYILKRYYALKNERATSANLDLLDIYYLLLNTTHKNFQVTDFYDFAYQKQTDKYDIKRQRIVDPYFYFEQALKETARKYPQNLKRAIKEALNGNLNYFTNDAHARDGLKKYVSPEQVWMFLVEKAKSVGYDVNLNEETLINLYLDTFYQENSYQEQYGIIKQAYLTTYEKYDYSQAHGALVNLIRSGRIEYFTNDLGFRDALREKVVGHDIIQIFRQNVPELMNFNDINVVIKYVEDDFNKGLKL